MAQPPRPRARDVRPRDVRAALRAARFGAEASLQLARYELTLRRLPEHERRTLLARARKRVATRLLDSLAVRVHAAGEPATNRPMLVVANHRAALDVGVLLTRLDAAFLSRADLAEWPVLGRMARHANTVFVDRASETSGANAIRAIRRHLAAGESVVVFPEGATFRGDEVQPFKMGAFAAARGLDVDVVPVGLAYPDGVEYVGIDFVTHLRNVASRPRTDVALEVGPAFSAKSAKTQELAERAQAEVSALVSNARKRWSTLG
jgi:1-acyl-sn-glycerol-3-phosphate acyltransferase